MIIKSPRYTGGDFMLLYQFVRRRRRCRRRPQTFVILGPNVGPDL